VERYSTIFQLIYGHRYISYSSIIPSYFEELLWSSFLYISVLVLGFLIATLYYRLSKVLKYVVSIGVPVFFLMILPILDTTLAEGNIYKTIITFMLFIFGKTTNGFNPYYTIISSLAISIILFVISYLLLRRATIKD
jgi:quinol-cytochrome oxidoreductase complex cytochrome b subunit